MTQYKLNWFNIIFFSIYTSALFILMPLYLLKHSPSALLITCTISAFIFSGLGVTAGYHRYFSHKCFNTTPIVEIGLLAAGTLATVNSALSWSHDHRLHHRHVDQELDPYNYQKGFFWAHIGWIMTDQIKYQPKMVQDLSKNKRVAWQHKHYLILAILANIFSILTAGYLCNDYFGATVFVFLLRLFCVHHATFAINSFAHFLGSQPFSKTTSAVNNWFVSLFTFGEGNHNYHHTFAYDYRNGPLWYNFDPTKWLIWSLNKLGIASKLKRVEQHKIYQAMLNERTDKLLTMIDKKYALRGDIRQYLLSKIKQKNIELNNKINELKKMAHSYKKLKEQWQYNQPMIKEITDKKLKVMQTMLNDIQCQFKVLYKAYHL